MAVVREAKFIPLELALVLAIFMQVPDVVVIVLPVPLTSMRAGAAGSIQSGSAGGIDHKAPALKTPHLLLPLLESVTAALVPVVSALLAPPERHRGAIGSIDPYALAAAAGRQVSAQCDRATRRILNIGKIKRRRAVRQCSRIIHTNRTAAYMEGSSASCQRPVAAEYSACDIEMNTICAACGG